MPQYKFIVADHNSYVRFDYEFASRNPWLAAIQDPRSAQYTQFPTAQSYTLPSTSFVQFRTGTTFGKWETSFFIDNLLNSHTTTNYERTFTDGSNPTYPPPGPQYNNYTFRPRTFGIRRRFATEMAVGPPIRGELAAAGGTSGAGAYRWLPVSAALPAPGRCVCGTPAGFHRPSRHRSCRGQG